MKAGDEVWIKARVIETYENGVGLGIPDGEACVMPDGDTIISVPTDAVVPAATDVTPEGVKFEQDPEHKAYFTRRVDGSVNIIFEMHGVQGGGLFMLPEVQQLAPLFRGADS